MVRARAFDRPRLSPAPSATSTTRRGEGAGGWPAPAAATPAASKMASKPIRPEFARPATPVPSNGQVPRHTFGLAYRGPWTNSQFRALIGRRRRQDRRGLPILCRRFRTVTILGTIAITFRGADRTMPELFDQIA